MKEVKLPGVGSVFHPGTDEEVDEAQKLLTARMEFTIKYCQEKGWPVPGDPDFEKRISFDQVLEIRQQPGWKDPLQDGNPKETAVLLGAEGSVIIPKGRN
jgi:hypothetical protein